MKTLPSHLPQVMTPAQAAALIPDEARLAFSGFATVGIAQAVMDAMIARYQRDGSPGRLTAYHAAGHGNNWGCDRLAAAGLLGKVVGAHWGLMNHLRRGMTENEIEAHNWPQGMIVRAFREMARGTRWGFTSTVGLGTFIDPRDWGGCMNAKARESGSMIRLETAPDGSEILRYSHLPIDYAIIRGWRADAYGNVALGMEALSLTQLEIALAARAQGGKVICQVRYHDTDRRFPSNEITIPGILIDHLVLADDPCNNHRQCEAYDEEPFLLVSGDTEKEVKLPPVPEGPRGWIGRRAAQEIRSGDVFNLGIGIPGETVTAALAEAGRLHDATPTLESGVIGGVGIGLNNFGIAVCPQARVDQGAMFDFYHSGGLDITVMGAAEIGENGDINVSLFDGKPTGCGGFIDITQNARRIIFCATLTAGGVNLEWRDGKVVVVQEGRFRKFVKKVAQVTFSAQQALAKGLNVRLVTERCVLELDEHGWTLIEIAPGISLEQDVLAHMEFCPRIAADLREMPESCFRP